MRKIGAALMALVMALPALAQPVCAATCGAEPAARFSCCCAPDDASLDATPSLTAPPCCPSEAGRADLRDLDGAVSAGAAARTAAGADRVEASPIIVAAADAVTAGAASCAGGPGGARATGPPIFIAVSSLRL